MINRSSYEHGATYSIIRKTIDELYSPESSGVVVLPNRMDNQLLREIQVAIEANSSAFEVKREKYISNNQTVALLYRGPYDDESNPLEETPFREIYEAWVRLRKGASDNSEVPFHRGSSLEIKIIHYPVSELGVDWHRDLSSNVNLIVFFNISGFGDIITKPEKDSPESAIVHHLTKPGAITLMRAPRNTSDQEKKIRPLHAVLQIPVPRVVLVLREIDEELEVETNAGNWRGF